MKAIKAILAKTMGDQSNVNTTAPIVFDGLDPFPFTRRCANRPGNTSTDCAERQDVFSILVRTRDSPSWQPRTEDAEEIVTEALRELARWL